MFLHLRWAPSELNPADLPSQAQDVKLFDLQKGLRELQEQHASKIKGGESGWRRAAIKFHSASQRWIDSRRSGKGSEGEETSKRARRWRGRQPAIEGLCQGQRPVHEDQVRAGKPGREQDDVDGGSEVAQGRHPKDFNAPEGDSSADGLQEARSSTRTATSAQ